MRVRRFLLGMAAGAMFVLGCAIGHEIGLLLIVFALMLYGGAILW